MPKDVSSYRDVQSRARRVLADIPEHIGPHSTELSISGKCAELLRERGIVDTWYYDAPAFVLLGSRSCLSISGREYEPAHEPVGQRNLVTIDLSPALGSACGDVARSFAVEGGVASTQPREEEFRLGFEAERSLHGSFRQYARPEATFAELFELMTSEIASLGFENLDFMGNVGHSIGEGREGRSYFAKGHRARLKDVEYFTFEPHIRLRNGAWGFKHENIYYFDANGIITEL